MEDQSGKPSPGGAGLALALLSAAAFGTSGTFASALIGSGWSPAAAVLARMAVAALAHRPRGAAVARPVGPAAAQRGPGGRLRPARGRRAPVVLLQRRGPDTVGVALLLEYLGVVLVVGWLWLRHGQRPRRLTITGGAVRDRRAGLRAQPRQPRRGQPGRRHWALLAAVGLGSSSCRRRGEEEPLPPLVMAWAGMCVGAAALAVVAGTGLLPIDRQPWRRPRPWPPGQLDRAGARAVAGSRGGLLHRGHRRRPPAGPGWRRSSALAEVLFAILFAWLLLGQLPTPVQFLGRRVHPRPAWSWSASANCGRPAGLGAVPPRPRQAGLAHSQAAGR